MAFMKRRSQWTARVIAAVMTPCVSLASLALRPQVRAPEVGQASEVGGATMRPRGAPVPTVSTRQDRELWLVEFMEGGETQDSEGTLLRLKQAKARSKRDRRRRTNSGRRTAANPRVACAPPASADDLPDIDAWRRDIRAPATPAGAAPAATSPGVVPARAAAPVAPNPAAAASTPLASPSPAPGTCLSGLCKKGRRDTLVPAIRAKVGKGFISMNLYADFGYAFGPQGRHRYYDYITKQIVEDIGRRDFTSYPLYVNQFALSYAYLQGQYEIVDKLRVRLAVHTGHIVESLYNEEPRSLQFVREAAIYYFFVPKLAVEAGIFPSYFGAELALMKENLHATRAYIADFSPDYEAGVRLHYHFRKDMALRLMVINGWQEIRDANGRKGFGLVWSVNRPGKIVGDWNMYWGNEAPRGMTPVFRHYQNLYYRIWLGKRWLTLPMLDLIVQKNNSTGGHDFVVSPAISLRLAISQRVGVAARYDYLYNKADIVPELKTGTDNGWQSHSATGTLEYLPLPQLTFRVEGRYGTNKDAVFRDGDNARVREDYYGIVSASFHF